MSDNRFLLYGLFVLILIVGVCGAFLTDGEWFFIGLAATAVVGVFVNTFVANTVDLVDKLRESKEERDAPDGVSPLLRWATVIILVLVWGAVIIARLRPHHG